MTTVDSSESTVETGKLRGQLGALAIVLMVIAAAAPLSVLGGIVPLGLIMGNGVGLPVLFLVGGAILLVFAVGFTHMTKHVPRSGAFFHYISAGLGRPPGLVAAWISIFSYLSVEVGLIAQISSVLADTVARVAGPQLHWGIYALLTAACVGTLGYRRIDLSTKVLGVVLSGEVLIIAVLSVAVLYTGGAEGLTLSTFGWDHVFAGAPIIGLMFCLNAFTGFESTAIYRDETKNPDTAIPRATYAAVLIVGIFYTFSSWMMIMAWGPHQVIDAASAHPTTLIIETTAAYLGPVGVVAINILLLTSVFAAILSFHNVVARYFHVLGNSGMLPRALGQAHRRHGSPHRASVTTSIITASVIVLCAACGLTATQVLGWSAGDATVGIIVLMAATALSVVVFFRRTKLSTSRWQAFIAPSLAFVTLSLIAIVIMMNYPLLVGETDAAGQPEFGPISTTLLLMMLPFIILGLVQAVVLKRRNPKAYAAITTLDG
ncbi:APC family permease [Mycolicibacterium sp. CH28]|uniref:APC family permease n=1 Tax=Mycolicibacterium sp. CH28 TaxID=2512237 RepID=UPI001082039D|nr:APC family permease [Mycolicibacterium sp. CH28]TGD87878.1 APC family permease [Mycolicibacterium sp. CH28]